MKRKLKKAKTWPNSRLNNCRIFEGLFLSFHLPQTSKNRRLQTLLTRSCPFIGHNDFLIRGILGPLISCPGHRTFLTWEGTLKTGFCSKFGTFLIISGNHIDLVGEIVNFSVFFIFRRLYFERLFLKKFIQFPGGGRMQKLSRFLNIYLVFTQKSPCTIASSNFIRILTKSYLPVTPHKISRK